MEKLVESDFWMKNGKVWKLLFEIDWSKINWVENASWQIDSPHTCKKWGIQVLVFW